MTNELKYYFSRIFYLLMILWLVAGMVHSLVFLPSFYIEDKDWKTLKVTDLTYVYSYWNYGSDSDSIGYAWRTATQDGTILFSEFSVPRPFQDDLKACLGTTERWREFAYKIDDWRSMNPLTYLFTRPHGKDGKIIIDRTLCDPASPEKIKLHLFVLNFLEVVSFYLAAAGLSFALSMFAERLSHPET